MHTRNYSYWVMYVGVILKCNIRLFFLAHSVQLDVISTEQSVWLSSLVQRFVDVVFSSIIDIIVVIGGDFRVHVLRRRYIVSHHAAVRLACHIYGRVSMLCVCVRNLWRWRHTVIIAWRQTHWQVPSARPFRYWLKIFGWFWSIHWTVFIACRLRVLTLIFPHNLHLSQCHRLRVVQVWHGSLWRDWWQQVGLLDSKQWHRGNLGIFVRVLLGAVIRGDSHQPQQPISSSATHHFTYIPDICY